MSTLLTRDLLSRLAPRPSTGDRRKNWEAYVGVLTSKEGQRLLEQFGITSKQRLAHALAQWAHESGGFTILYESGAYSATRIMQIFGVGKHSARVTEKEARALAGNAYALFERVYGLGNPKKARDLGNTQKGDGFNFRGMGIVQLTGRSAWERYAAKIGCSVKDLPLPKNNLHGALLEWKEKGCNVPADRDDIVEVTRRINGGKNGLADRQTYLAKAKKLLANAVAQEEEGDAIVIPAADGEVVEKDRQREPELIELGAESETIRHVQELLVRAGYAVKVDGKMGTETQGELAKFQVHNGLTGTGKPDEETIAALERARPPVPKPVDPKVLKDTNVVFKLIARIRFIAVWLFRSVFGLAGAEASGLDVLENIGSGWERAAAIWVKFDFPMGLSSPKTLGLLLVSIAAFGLWMVAKWATTAMEEKQEEEAA
jgi:putative chitinase